MADITRPSFFSLEGAARAAQQAKVGITIIFFNCAQVNFDLLQAQSKHQKYYFPQVESSPTVETNHLEKILPQLVRNSSHTSKWFLYQLLHNIRNNYKQCFIFDCMTPLLNSNQEKIVSIIIFLHMPIIML